MMHEIAAGRLTTLFRKFLPTATNIEVSAIPGRGDIHVVAHFVINDWEIRQAWKHGPTYLVDLMEYHLLPRRLVINAERVAKGLTFSQRSGRKHMGRSRP